MKAVSMCGLLAVLNILVGEYEAANIFLAAGFIIVGLKEDT